MNILGIETSCDETAAAVVRNGSDIRSSVVASQIETHRYYGGVVPELASRKHIEAIVPVIKQALCEADTELYMIDAIAVTQGPGLVGSLLVGFSAAKSIALALEKPWIGVDHLIGHINSVFLTPDNKPEFPLAALLVSGGHTALYYVSSHTDIALMGRTRDDAVGEAFDKVSKMLGLGYPGGPIISRLAEQGNPAYISFPKAYLDKNSFDFSFSGLKTAVKRFIHEQQSSLDETMKQHIAAGFQEAVTQVLTDKLVSAVKASGCKHAALVGGVAANPCLRAKLNHAAKQHRFCLYMPPLTLCGDNAAMIAAAGYHYFNNGPSSNIDADINADVYSRSTGIPVWS